MKSRSPVSCPARDDLLSRRLGERDSAFRRLAGVSGTSGARRRWPASLAAPALWPPQPVFSGCPAGSPAENAMPQRPHLGFRGGDLSGARGAGSDFLGLGDSLLLEPVPTLVRHSRLPLRLIRPPLSFRRLPFRFRDPCLGRLQLRRVRCDGLHWKPLQFVQAGLRRFRSPAGLRHPRFRLARPLGCFLNPGQGRFPLRLGRCDRLRGGDSSLPEVSSPSATRPITAVISPARRWAAAARSSAVLARRPASSAVVCAARKASRSASRSPSAPDGPFALCGQLAGQLPCPGFRGFRSLVQSGH